MSEQIAEFEAKVERLRQAGYEHGWRDAMVTARMAKPLTAEQVQAVIFAHSSCAGRVDGKYFAEDIRMQAIADELNAARESVDDTRWSELFGTPEKAADMLSRALVACSDCVLEDECIKMPDDASCLVDDEATLLEWLRGKAVKR